MIPISPCQDIFAVALVRIFAGWDLLLKKSPMAFLTSSTTSSCLTFPATAITKFSGW
jgi:hypothetical protein